MEQYEKLTDEQLIEKLHSGDRDVTDYLMEKYKMMHSQEGTRNVSDRRRNRRSYSGRHDRTNQGGKKF